MCAKTATTRRRGACTQSWTRLAPRRYTATACLATIHQTTRSRGARLERCVGSPIVLLSRELSRGPPECARNAARERTAPCLLPTELRTSWPGSVPAQRAPSAATRSRRRPPSTQATAPAIDNPERQRPPLNLAFVVDRSGSMSGGALELARQGCSSTRCGCWMPRSRGAGGLR